MKEIKTLYDVGTEIEAVLPLLEQSLSALTVTMEAMEHDGFQPKGKKIDKALAVNFAARFPMYFNVLELLLRDMWNTFDFLHAGVDSIFEADKMRRKEHQEAG